MTLAEIKHQALQAANDAFWQGVETFDDLTAMNAALAAYEAAMVRPVAEAPPGVPVLTFDPGTERCAWCEDVLDAETGKWSIDSESTATHFRPLPAVALALKIQEDLLS